MNSTKVIKLGEKIVNELLLKDGVDTLSKWMAHYIAELIEKAKCSEGEEKEKYEKECFETIIKLWNEIYKVPNVEKPLTRFDDMYELIKEVTNNSRYRYFQSKHEEIQCEYLQLIKIIDILSKKIIRKAIFMGIENSLLDEKEWLEFDLLGLEDISSLMKIKTLYEDVELDSFEINKKERDELKKAINSFNKVLENLDIQQE